MAVELVEIDERGRRTADPSGLAIEEIHAGDFLRFRTPAGDERLDQRGKTDFRLAAADVVHEADAHDAQVRFGRMRTAEDDLEIRIRVAHAPQSFEGVADRLAVGRHAQHFDAELANDADEMVERILRVNARQVVVHHLAADALVSQDRLQDVDAWVRERAVDVAHRRDAKEHRNVALGLTERREVVSVVQPVAHATADHVRDCVVGPHPASCHYRVDAHPYSRPERSSPPVSVERIHQRAPMVSCTFVPS